MNNHFFNGCTFEISIDIFDFIIEIINFNEKISSDIEYIIYEIWEDGDKRQICIVPDSHHLYKNEMIREKAIDRAFLELYESKMEG